MTLRTELHVPDSSRPPALGHVTAPLVDPRVLADALDAALARLAGSLDAAGDLDVAARAVGTTRRAVLEALVGHLDRACAAFSVHAARGGRAPADPTDATTLATGDGSALARAVGTRRCRLAEAFELALEVLPAGEVADEVDFVDELDALLARVELAHVSLGVHYDLLDLPPASVAACARVSDAFERTRLPGEPRIRPTARRRSGIASPRGRGSS